MAEDCHRRTKNVDLAFIALPVQMPFCAIEHNVGCKRGFAHVRTAGKYEPRVTIEVRMVEADRPALESAAPLAPFAGEHPPIILVTPAFVRPHVLHEMRFTAEPEFLQNAV